MTQPAPGYRPYQQPMAPMMGVAAPPKPSRGGVTTLLAGVLALIVAGMAVGGSFGAISTYRNEFDVDGDTSVYASKTTWWGFNDDGSSSAIEGEGILAGLTLVLAATLLVVGAVFAFVAARRSGALSGTRSLLSAGVGVLAGVSVLQLLAVLRQMGQYNEQELDAGESLEFSAGLGLWLPLGGLVLGVVAVVLAHVGRRAEVRVEPNTPRMGFPAPYGYRPQQMPVQQAPVAERPTDVTDEDDAADTQVVSGATAAGSPSAAAPAPTTPPAPTAAPAPAAPPLTPATTAMPEGGPSGSADEPAAEPAGPAAPAASAADSTEPAQPTPPSEPPASPEAAPPATAPEPPLTPATTAAPEGAPAAPAAAAESAAPTEPAGPASAADSTEPAQPTPPSEPPASPEAAAAAEPPRPAAPTTPAAPAAGATEPEDTEPEDTEPEDTEAAKPSPLSDLPAAPPAPELSSSDDKTEK